MGFPDKAIWKIHSLIKINLTERVNNNNIFHWNSKVVMCFQNVNYIIKSWISNLSILNRSVEGLGA